MSPDLVDALIGEMRPLGVRWAVLSGGEAMQHPEWDRIAQRMRAQGARVILLTNGLLLKKQAQRVIESVDEVVVSLDGGTAATYEAIRGVDAFDLILDGIRLVRAGGVSVTTRTTVQRDNFREMPLIIETAKAADVNLISFLTVDVSNPFAFGARFPLTGAVAVEHEPPASALTRDDVPELARVLAEVEARYTQDFAAGRIAESPAKLRLMLDYFSALNSGGDHVPVRCNAPHISVVVEVDGSLRPCYFLPTVARVRRHVPLRAALNDPAAVAMRQAYRAGERVECVGCVCPLYKGVRALVSL